MAFQLGADQIGAADQVHAKTQMASGRERAVHGTRRRVIAAHRVNRDAHNLCLICV